jgi:hypothetical protein
MDTQRIERRDREIRLAYAELVGAIIIDPSLSKLVEWQMPECPDHELRKIAAGVFLSQAGASDERLEQHMASMTPNELERAERLGMHVLEADDDWTPERFVEEQTNRLERFRVERSWAG